MSKRFLALAAALFLIPPAALAADNLVGVQADTAKTPYSVRTKEVSPGVHVPAHWLVDQLGVAFGTSGNPIAVTLPSGQTVTLGAGSAAIGTVTVSNLPATQPVSATALPLPAGAATAAKQPAIGTAGTPSADVVSVQGVANGTPQNVETVSRSASVDRGGTVTAGGTAQTFMAANTSRRGFLVQNQSSGDLYVNCLGTAAATQSSLRIPAGALYETSPHHVGTGACSVFGATTGQAFYAREF